MAFRKAFGKALCTGFRERCGRAVGSVGSDDCRIRRP